jgi:hypothetical protein
LSAVKLFSVGTRNVRAIRIVELLRLNAQSNGIQHERIIRLIRATRVIRMAVREMRMIKGLLGWLSG